MKILDYYAVLGVLPDAEDIVIRAAYKALAQKYHPDRYPDKEEAAKRMAEVNQAYEALGDPVRRRKYDESRSAGGEPSYSDVSDDENEGPVYSQTQKDWLLACEYYPDLTELLARLNQTSKRLALTYMLYLLETKCFDQRSKVAADMELTFLKKYFGTNPDILDFARLLIKRGNKPALIYLNDTVRVLGASTDPKKIIVKIIGMFPLHSGVKSFSDQELSIAVPYWSQFRLAVVNGDIDTIKMLLFKAPALVAGQDTEGNTCLHLAVPEQKWAAIAVLLENGANPEVPNIYKTTALDLARNSKSAEVKTVFTTAGYVV